MPLALLGVLCFSMFLIVERNYRSSAITNSPLFRRVIGLSGFCFFEYRIKRFELARCCKSELGIELKGSHFVPFESGLAQIFRDLRHYALLLCPRS